MKGNKKRSGKKSCKAQSMSLFLASVLVASAGGVQDVYAQNGKSQSAQEKQAEQSLESGNTSEEEAASERSIVYLNGKTGNDRNQGKSEEEAVLTFARASELAGEYGVIRICGTVTVSKKTTWTLPDGVCIRRADGFEDALVKVTGSLTLDNVRMYTDDITGDGTVKGAVEREKVYVPSVMTIEEPGKLADVSLERCEGDGAFAWEDEDIELTEYEMTCKVVFRPKDIKEIDYSQEKGWDEEEKVVVRKVTIRVRSLKPEEGEMEEGSGTEAPDATPTPETTPEATPTVTPEVTVEATPAPETTPEATPTPETTPEVTPSTPEATPTVTPEENSPETPPEGGQPGNGTENGTETNPDATPEASPTPVQEEGNGGMAEEKPEGVTEEEWAAIVNVQNLVDTLPEKIDADETVEAVVTATKAYEALTEAQCVYLNEQTAQKLSKLQEKAAVWNRTSNDVTIEGDFPWYVRFLAEKRAEEPDEPGRAENELVFPYDFILWDMMNDCIYDMNGKSALITMPLPEDGRYDKMVMIHYLPNGTVEYITPVYNEDETMTVATASFAEPELIAFTARIAGSNSLVGNTDKVYNPPAGNGSQNSSNSGTKPSMGSGSSQTSGKTNTGKNNGSQSGSSNKGSSSSVSTGSSGSNRVTNNSGSSRKPVSVTVRNPDTGDTMQPTVYAGLAGAALAAMGYSLFRRKKRANRTDDGEENKESF